MISYFVRGQDSSDTLISKKEIENFKWEIYELKTANKKLEYENYFISHFYKKDTVKKSKDTLIVAFYSKDKKLLRRVIELYINVGKKFKTDSLIEFYNNKGLIEYVEKWACLNSIYDSPEWGDIRYVEIRPRIGGAADRYEYDEKNRIKLLIAELANGAFIRCKDTYDQNGKFIKRISNTFENRYEFWE